MKLLLVLILTLSCVTVIGQKIEFKKSSLEVKEPVPDKEEKEQTFEILFNSPDAFSNVKIEAASASTHPAKKFTFTTITKNFTKGENKIEVKVTTDLISDKTTFIIFKVSYVDNKSESQLIEDTLFIKNTFPLAAMPVEEYTDWNDGKRVDVFIGTNFDFFGDRTLTDWYGGVRVFLPAITDLGFSDDVKKKYPRWGMAGGIYHSRSFSNFGNNTSTDTVGEFTRFIGYNQEVINGTIFTRTIRRVDSLKVKAKNEINNWGAYIAPLYQWSRYKSSDGKFITNIFLGAHCEVIRRNIHTTYTFDSLGTHFDTLANIRSFRLAPKDSKKVYYDAYFGISVPLQFLWKDVLDFRVNPCIGFGSPGNNAAVDSHWFYLFQFDLLARLGGLKLNLGGEVRGYLPSQNPIFTAYVGTAFSIQKLSDFVSK